MFIRKKKKCEQVKSSWGYQSEVKNFQLHMPPPASFSIKTDVFVKTKVRKYVSCAPWRHTDHYKITTTSCYLHENVELCCAHINALNFDANKILVWGHDRCTADLHPLQQCVHMYNENPGVGAGCVVIAIHLQHSVNLSLTVNCLSDGVHSHQYPVVFHHCNLGIRSMSLHKVKVTEGGMNVSAQWELLPCKGWPS